MITKPPQQRAHVMTVTGQVKVPGPPGSPFWVCRTQATGANEVGCTSILLADFFPCQVLTPGLWSFCLFSNFQMEAETPAMLADGWGGGGTHLGLLAHPAGPQHPWVVPGGGNCSCRCLQDWCLGHLLCLGWEMVTEQLTQWTTSQAAFLRYYHRNVVMKMWPWIHHLTYKNSSCCGKENASDVSTVISFERGYTRTLNFLRNVVPYSVC